MITEDYISFEIAKLLKEKGFEEDINIWYDEKGETFFCNHYDIKNNWRINNYQKVYQCPTIQMAMKWIREEKDLIANIWWSNGEDTAWCAQYLAPVSSNPKLNHFVLIGEGYKTYEEACEASIKYCLENLL